MSVNIQQADKTLKKVADTTVVNKATIEGALEYTPASTDQLNTAKTELTNSINTAKTDLTNSIGEVSSNLSTTANNLQQQIDALEGSAFDGDYNKLTNAPILNEADGTATFADETGNIIARIDNNGFETTNLNLHGDIELADKTLEIIDETGNIVLCIDDNGVKTAITEELKEQVDNNKTAINTKAPIDSPTFTGIPKAPIPEEGANAEQVATVGYVAGAVAGLQEDIGDVFEFNDDGALTIADEQGNILAQFAVEEDAEGNIIETGLKVTDVATNNINSLNTEISNINTKINNRINAANSATADNIVLFTDTHNIKDSGKKIVTAINDADIPTGEAVKNYVSGEIASYDENANAAISQTYATKTELNNKATELSGATAAVATDLEEHITETDGRGKLHITAAERTAWDAAKDYNNLENKPIEQDGNDKEFIITYNDENHIMARINDTGLRVLDVEIGPEGSSTTLSTKFSNIDTELSNRYTETETDQKIAEAIANADHLKREIVDTLPTTNIDPRIIYMVKAASNEISNQDIYDEYMYINNAWERLGSWQTDLSGYAKKTDVTDLQIFKTIRVENIDIEANNNADILTLEAGSNIAFQVDPENNTINISSIDTNLNGIDIVGTGNAVTSGIYSTKTKKVTLLKGETFTTKDEYDEFVNEFNDNFNLTNDDGTFEIVDDPEETGSDTQNILARFDSEGLTTVGATFTNPITVGDPEADTDAATKGYVDNLTAEDVGALSLSNGGTVNGATTFTKAVEIEGSFSLASAAENSTNALVMDYEGSGGENVFNIQSNLGTYPKITASDPTSASHVATKKYVDDAISSQPKNFAITVTDGVANKTNNEVMTWILTTRSIVNNLFNLTVVENLGEEESGTGITYSVQRIYKTVDWKVSEANEFVWKLSTTVNNIVYECEVVCSVKAENKNIPVSITFTQIEVGSTNMYDVIENVEKLKVNGAEEQAPIEVTLSSDTYTDFSTIKVVMTYGESTQEAMANVDGIVSGLMAEPEFELSLISDTEGFDATLVNIQCRYKIDLEHILHDYVLHVDVDSEEDDSENIKLNSVYIQNDEPVDAVIGSVWIDTNETGLDVPGEEYNKNLYIIDSSGSDSSEIDFSSYAVGDIILVTSS